MIHQWFLNKGTYQEGLELLRKACGANQRMYLRLKNEKPTQRNYAALKYELNKYKDKELAKSVVSQKVKNSPVRNKKTEETFVTSALKKTNIKITLAMLPDAYLQQRFIEKNNAFYKRWFLKKQLNALPNEEEEKALEIIAEIMKLTKLIDTIWAELDYFILNKKRMPSGNDFSGLSNMELIKSRQRLYQSRSKREKTLNKWIESFKDTPKEKQLALQSKIDNQTEKITQINIDIEKLNTLINE